MKRDSKRLWDLPSALLLVLALLAASQRLYATNWTPGLGVPVVLTILGVTLGLALGISKFERRGVFWLATGYSLFLIPLVSAWILYQNVPWLERMTSLGGRLGYSLVQFFSYKPVPDTALFVVFTGIGYWFISLAAGYEITRYGNITKTIAPAGIVTFIIQIYDSRVGDRVIILAIYILLSLLILGRQTYVRKRVVWKAQRVSISTDSWTDLNIAVAVVTVILVVLAWIIPTSAQPLTSLRHAWDSLTKPLQQTRQELGNITAGLQSSSGVVAGDFYGSTLSLGLRASTSDTMYLSVHAPVTVKADRYYWRVRTYDQYVNHVWSTNDAHQEAFTPDMSSLQVADANGIPGEFIFSTSQANISVLITPSHPVWVSRPSVLSFIPSAGNSVDPLMFTVDSLIQIGDQYKVHANVFNPTITQLQQAGTNYPTWVMDNYLQLPDNVPPQIVSLARQLTAASITPYDKATAITNYLRSNITYSTTVSPAPAGIDPLVWFLFDQKSGFCNYYATAEVIMLRIAGVPARMVVGFAQGKFQAPDNYIVLEKDAHAWPEVFFPAIGWVEFEPTTIQPVLVRQEGSINPTEQPEVPPGAGGQNNNSQNPQQNEGSGTTSTPSRSPKASVVIISFLVVLIILIAASVIAYTTGFFGKAIKRLLLKAIPPLPILLTNAYAGLDASPPTWVTRWAYYTRLTPVERAFGVIYQSLRWLGQNPAAAQTPSEAGAALAAILPESKQEIDTLVLENEHALFSQRHVDLYIAKQAGTIIRRRAMRAALHRTAASILRIFSRKQKNEIK